MKKRLKIKFFIGTSGWSYLHWRGRFYPQELSSYKWLEHYAKHFNTAEVNMTFYRWPNETLLKNWYKRTPQEFYFTLKAPQTITHIKKLKNVEVMLKQFYQLASLLKEKLACILFQLPPSLKFNYEKLEGFLQDLNLEFKNVIEFRNESWWQDSTYKLMKKYNTSFCIVSAPRLPDEAIITSKIAYIRFHGLGWYSSNYSNAELKKWAEKIKKATKSCREVYCYFNNDYNAYAIYNAIELKKLLTK